LALSAERRERQRRKKAKAAASIFSANPPKPTAAGPASQVNPLLVTAAQWLTAKDKL
jgi:hypothetical protein